MDLVTSLPSTRHGNNAIFTIVDRFSKYVTFLPTKIAITAEDLA